MKKGDKVVIRSKSGNKDRFGIVDYVGLLGFVSVKIGGSEIKVVSRDRVEVVNPSMPMVKYIKIDQITKEHEIVELETRTRDAFSDEEFHWTPLPEGGWIRHGGRSECPVPYNYWIKFKLLGEVNKNPAKHYTVYTGSAEIRWDQVHSYKLLSYRDSDGVFRPFFPSGEDEDEDEYERMQTKIKFPAYISILEEGEDPVDGDLILANLYHVKSLDHLQYILLFCCGGIETMDEIFTIIYNQETLTIRVKTSITIE